MAKKSKTPLVDAKEKEAEVSEETEEVLFGEEDLENSGLRELLDKGKDQGFLTYQEINSMLPEDISDPDQVEETIQMLMDIGIEVHAAFGADWVGLHEPAERGRVHTGLVIVEAQFRQPCLPGIAEPPQPARARNAVFIVAVDRQHRARGIEKTVLNRGNHQRMTKRLVIMRSGELLRKNGPIPVGGY